MKTILFQGDSITDCNRNRELSHEYTALTCSHLGNGYALMAAAQLGYDHPQQYRFINKAISGNRIVDLYARIKTDIINLRPDYVSILIGVNDVWAEIDSCDGVDADKFEKLYCLLIEEIHAALPETKIMVLEPYIMKEWGTDNTKEMPHKWDVFREEVHKRAEKAKLVAQKYNLPFITLQDKFDAAANKAPVICWLSDGVHPTPLGHEIIKKAWLDTFQTIC